MEEDDVEAEEAGSEDEVAELEGVLVELFPLPSPPSSPSSPVLLRSSENIPASRCCSMSALGSVEFGDVTPKAQIKDCTDSPVFVMSNARMGLVSEVLEQDQT